MNRRSSSKFHDITIRLLVFWATLSLVVIFIYLFMLFHLFLRVLNYEEIYKIFYDLLVILHSLVT